MQRVTLEKVCKTFNRGKPNETRVLTDINLSIDPGSFTILKGPSGSGKTTLLCIIGCLTRPTSGKVFIGNENFSKLPEKFLAGHRRNTFGFIFQQNNLISQLSVIENVMAPLYPTTLGFSKMREMAYLSLEKVGLQKRADERPNTLSGGEQQRVSIARALVNDPGIILADEPTAHLDYSLTQSLLQQIDGIRREGRTVMVATHDHHIYSSGLADKVIEIEAGEVKLDGSR